MTTTDIETLADEAACINSCIPQGMQLAVLINLANQIISGGIGGGSGQIKFYTADPNVEAVVPNDQTKPAIAYSISGAGSIYGWNPNTLLWV